MLIGLIRWRIRVGQGIASSLTHFLWKQVGLWRFFRRCLGFTGVISVRQGLVWTFLATLAYVPPVVSLAISVSLFFTDPHLTSQIFLSLNFNGNFLSL